MTEGAPVPPPTLAEIKANLLEVRDHVQFSIGSPAAIDHLLISIVAVIDALDNREATLPNTQGKA